jgi:hypothetical protein
MGLEETALFVTEPSCGSERVRVRSPLDGLHSDADPLEQRFERQMRCDDPDGSGECRGLRHDVTGTDAHHVPAARRGIAEARGDGLFFGEPLDLAQDVIGSDGAASA